MFGVLLGLYLNSYFENQSLLKSKKDAMVQVIKELENNRENLQKYNDILQEKYDGFSQMLNYIDKDFRLVVPVDSLSHFLQQTASVFKLESKEAIGDNQLLLKGEMSLYVESSLVVTDLSDIIWNTFKQTNFLSITSFECLSGIEGIYNSQKDLNKQNSLWRDVFFQGEFLATSMKTENFMNLWKNLLLKQELVLKMYEFTDDLVASCE